MESGNGSPEPNNNNSSPLLKTSLRLSSSSSFRPISPDISTGKQVPLIKPTPRRRMQILRPSSPVSQLFENPESWVRRNSSRNSSPGRNSPVNSSIPLFKELSENPNWKLNPTLGPKSSAAPGLLFSGHRSGGGFTAQESTMQSESGLEESFQKSMKIYSARKKKGLKVGPNPPKKKNPKRVAGRFIEFHPGGGIHQGYDESTEKSGGSYFKLKDGRLKKKNSQHERRVGRHGLFSNTQRFDKLEMKGFPRTKQGLAKKRGAQRKVLQEQDKLPNPFRDQQKSKLSPQSSKGRVVPSLDLGKSTQTTSSSNFKSNFSLQQKSPRKNTILSFMQNSNTNLLAPSKVKKRPQTRQRSLSAPLPTRKKL